MWLKAGHRHSWVLISQKRNTCCSVREIQQAHMLSANCIKDQSKSQKSIMLYRVYCTNKILCLSLADRPGHSNAAGWNKSRGGHSTLSFFDLHFHHFSTVETTERAKLCEWPTKIGTSSRNYTMPRSPDSPITHPESVSHSNDHCWIYIW